METDTIAPPTTPPTPEPTPAPTGEPTQSSGFNSFDDKFKDLDNLDAPTPPPEPKAEKKTTAPAKPDATKKETVKPDATKPEVAKDKPEPDDDNVPQSGTPTELRKFAQRQVEKSKKFSQELQQAKRELDEARKGGQSNGEVKALTEQLAATKKQLEEYENTTRLTKYETSNDYKENFVKPYEQAKAMAYREVKELLVTEGEEGMETERPATEADFAEVYQLPLGLATKLAKKKFGDAASTVIQHRGILKSLSEKAYNAVEEWRNKGQEHEKQETARSATERQALGQMWTKVNDDFVTRSPEWFAERDDDPEGNELLQKGFRFADMTFAERNSMTPQQRVMADARMRNWAASFPRAKRDITSLKAENETLKAQIAEMQGSAPGKPQLGSGEAPAGRKSLDDAIDSLPG